MATTMYGLARDGFLEIGYHWLPHGQRARRYSLAFVTTGYTPAYTTDQYLGVAISGGNIIAQSGTFASLSSSLGTANAANETVTSVSGAQFAYVVLYSFITNNNSSPLIMNIDTATGLPCTPNGGNIVVQWDTGTNKIFTLCKDVGYVGQGAWATIRDGVRMLFDRTYTGRQANRRRRPDHRADGADVPRAGVRASGLSGARGEELKEIEKRSSVGRIPVLSQKHEQP